MTLAERATLLQDEMGTILHVCLRSPRGGVTHHPALPEVWRIAQRAMDRAAVAPVLELRAEALEQGLADVVALCLRVNHLRATDLAYVLDVAEQALEKCR